MKFIFILTVIVLPGCASFQREDSGVETEQRSQRTQLQEAEQLLLDQKFDAAAEAFDQFRKTHQGSIYFQQAQMGLAFAWDGMGRWAEASELLSDVITATRERNPKVAAEAYLASALVNEALGLDAKVFAALLDAQRMKKYLPREKAEAELPARLAVYYYRTGDEAKARQYFQEAEKSVTLLYGDENLDAMAQTFYFMGAMSTNQLGPENLSSLLDAITYVQVFSLRAMETSTSGWAQRAAEGLKSNYRDLWRTILQWPPEEGLDAVAAKKNREEKQVQWMGRYLRMIEKMKLYRSPDPNKSNSVVEDFFVFLEKSEKQGENFLMAKSRNRIPLTPEASRRQSLKKEGLVLSAPETPVDKKAEEPADAETKPPKEAPDPNL